MLRGLMAIRVLSIRAPFFDISLKAILCAMLLGASGEVVAVEHHTARDPVLMRVGDRIRARDATMHSGLEGTIEDRSRNQNLLLSAEAVTKGHSPRSKDRGFVEARPGCKLSASTV